MTNITNMNIRCEIASILFSVIFVLTSNQIYNIDLTKLILILLLTYFVSNNLIFYFKMVKNDYNRISKSNTRCKNCNHKIYRRKKDSFLKCYNCGWVIGNKITRLFIHSIFAKNMYSIIKHPEDILSSLIISIIKKFQTSIIYIARFVFNYPFLNISVIVLILLISTTVIVITDHNNKEIVSNNQTEINITETEQLVFDMVNKRRTAFNPLKDELKYNRKLSKRGIKHARDMARNNYFSHTSLDGTKASERYSFCESSENIHQTWINRSVRDPESIGNSATYIDTKKELADNIVEGWMNSKPHRKNIYRDKWESMSIDIAVSEDNKVYAVQSFCT